MVAVGSLKLIGRHPKLAVEEKLAKVRPWSLGDAIEGGSADGADVAADLAADRLILRTSGLYLILAQGIVTPDAGVMVRLRAVVGEDPRYAGPVTITPSDVETDRRIGDLVRAVNESKRFHGRAAEPTIHAPARCVPDPKHWSMWGIVPIPDAAGPTPVELWANSLGKGGGEADVSFLACELAALKLN